MKNVIYLLFKLIRVKTSTYDRKRLAFDVNYTIFARIRLLVKHAQSFNNTQKDWAKPLPPAIISGFKPAVTTERHWQLLTCNENAFNQRYHCLEQAKKSIDISTYILRNDETGNKFIKLLAKMASKGVKVRILLDKVDVDGEIFADKNFIVFLSSLKKHKIEYRLSGNFLQRNHCKLLIIDEQYLIIGGRNYSDHYSIKGWRDLELLTWHSQIIKNAQNLFNSLWDIDDAKKITYDMQKNSPFLINLPHLLPLNPIVQTFITHINAAQRSIDIENAYFINVEVINEALIAAHKRGVKVRIFTNSVESNDLPHNSIVMLNSLVTLREANIPVYLQQGRDKTLHSKYYIIDKKMVMIGSYNFNAYSPRFCLEANVYLEDTQLAAALSEYFEQGIIAAKPFIVQTTKSNIKFWWLRKIIGQAYIDLC